MTSYEATTHSVRVQAVPFYSDKQSVPYSDRYVWGYRISIENLGVHSVQLLRRHWKVVDETGYMQEIKGDGVIGEQPVILPGKEHVYTSGVFLDTPSGMMLGSYHMVESDTGELFEVEIPAFSLDSPSQLAIVN